MIWQNVLFQQYYMGYIFDSQNKFVILRMNNDYNELKEEIKAYCEKRGDDYDIAYIIYNPVPMDYVAMARFGSKNLESPPRVIKFAELTKILNEYHER